MDSISVNTEITILGEAKIPSPVQNRAKGANRITFVSDNDRVVIDVREHSIVRQVKEGQAPSCFQLAGPRSNIFFDPSKRRIMPRIERYYPFSGFRTPLGLWCS
jgi:6-phosphofructokinase 1